MMQKIFFRSILVLGILFCSLSVKAQGSDEKARELVSLAKRYFNTRNYLDAAMTFELATQRPSNDLSSFSYYMAGVSYFQANEKEKARVAIDKFIAKYPKSDYLEDANYHKALLLMESQHVNDREKGLDAMFKLIQNTSNKRLRADAETTTKYYLSNVLSPDFLDLYVVFASEAFKPWVMEGMVAQWDRSGQGFLIPEKIKAYREKGGQMTPTLVAFEAKSKQGGINYADRLNIAVFLSFNLQLMDTATHVPSKSEKALEMMEGMMLALDSLGKGLSKRINVAVFDTQGDTLGMRPILDSLKRFHPDVIIGDMRTAVAGCISDWAEQNKVVHLIPRNAFNELIEGKKYTFLIHPSLNTHGKLMAAHLFENEGKRNFVVFNDRTFYSDKFSKAFLAELAKHPEAMVSEKVVPSRYADLQPKLSAEIKSIKGSACDLIYAPLSNEESAGLLISKLNYDGIKTDLAGGPDWETYTVIDQELKTSYNLKYSSFYFESNDSSAFDGLYQACLQQYGYRPSPYTVQGFDLMAWLLNTSQAIGPQMSLLDAIHKANPYHGIHQDFYYGDFQDNQRINVLQYNYGRIDKVNRDKEE